MIKRLYRSTMSSQRQSLYLFGSLEVHRTAYSGTTYTIDDKTLVPYAMSNGVRLARLHYESAVTVPQVAGTGLTDDLGKTNTAATLHVLLELGDHLGSTGTVLDKVSSELVERTGYLPFGARENDYRPSRWNGFREDYGFTGKEEDVQVGLVYFGKRYLSPQLGRWLSADPLAIHAPGRADFNLYAYVEGTVLSNTDPMGLACGHNESCDVESTDAQTGQAADVYGKTSTESYSEYAAGKYEQEARLQRSFEPNGGKEASVQAPSPTAKPWDGASPPQQYTPNFEALAGPLGAVGFALTYAGSSLAGASPQEAREAATRAAVDLAPVDGMLMGAAAARSQRADVAASCQTAPQGVVPERARPTVAPKAETKGVAPSSLRRTHEIGGNASSRQVVQMAEEMRQSGFNGPPIDVVVKNGTHYIVDGHHRLAAAKMAGLKEVPIRVLDDLASHPSGWASVDEVVSDAAGVGRNNLRHKGKLLPY